ncbi:MAG: hypothetical protein AAF703_23240 [Cyanobacteria bacterium P01_D01_bin.105]
MLQIRRFDVKTGKPIEETIEGQQHPSVKLVDNAYLEHWLSVRGIDAEFSVGRFYDGINEADRLRLENEGKVLVFTNGQDGYFTDPMTAQLMTEGSDAIAPIYVNSSASAHNSVAYGSLIASDGISSTSVSHASILIIDNAARTHGNEPLVDSQGQPVAADELARLYNKMGDGTMLISQAVSHALTTTEEHNQIAGQIFEKAGIRADISDLGVDNKAVERANQEIEKKLYSLAHNRVSQFRAGTPVFPGIAKGTMSVSRWTERLGVDFIISVDDIKGGSQVFLTPGRMMVTHFWVNRKTDAEYGQQGVGPQVKYNIPAATEKELNPIAIAQAEAVAAVVSDQSKLEQYYVQQQEKRKSRPYETWSDQPETIETSDWMYDVLTGDDFSQLAGIAPVNRKLNRYVSGEWKRSAMHGITLPSAMAQHHSLLKPWEVSNRDLPHGAIVAYFRSPFPNVSAAVIAINNTEILRTEDAEAFFKQGVAYLPPSTAREIAITDFDGDRNAFFVGYMPTVADLPERVRESLSDVEPLPELSQYEAGRAFFERMIHRLEKGSESRIVEGDYPLTVKEFTELTAPALRPPTVVKQAKELHPWRRAEESRSAAVWRAWQITANNPIGKVANSGMTLQAMALDLKYAPQSQQEALLSQVAAHYTKLLVKADAGKLFIPSDAWLEERGFPSYRFRERLERISTSALVLLDLNDLSKRESFISSRLRLAYNLLFDAAFGLNAANLQAAMDSVKSAKGIDENLHKFIRALQHKPDLLRQNKDNPKLYTGKTVLQTSTQEPIAWGVETVNKLYESAQQSQQLEERPNVEFQAILPLSATPEQQAIAKQITQTYNGLLAQAKAAKQRVYERRPEDQQPTLKVILPDGDRTFVLHGIQDPKGTLPIWRADGPQPDWVITVSRDPQAKAVGHQFSAKLSFTAEDATRRTQSVGYVAPGSTVEHKLEQRLTHVSQTLSVKAPSVEMRVPFAQENDASLLFDRADRYMAEAFVPSEGIEPAVYRQQIASALWRSHESRHIVFKHFSDVMQQRLKTVPPIRLMGLQYTGHLPSQLAASGPRTIRFGTDTYTKKTGEVVTNRAVFVSQPNGEFKKLGTIDDRAMSLPEGSTFLASFSVPSRGKNAVDMSVMSLPVIAQSKAEIEAFRTDGRCHLTSDLEPYAAYGVQKGDILLAQAEGQIKGQTVALRVGNQYVIDETRLASANFPIVWAEMEKSAPDEIERRLDSARESEGRLWGLTVRPLGDYAKGQITAFPEMTHERYKPSRQELREFYMWAISQENAGLAAQIHAKGLLMRALYQASAEGNKAEPPMDYKHELVVMKHSDVQTLQRSKESMPNIALRQQAKEPALERG